MNWQTVLSLIAGGVALLGAFGTWVQARSTGKKTVADMYGEALDRLDRRLGAAEREIASLKRDLKAERAHSSRQDARISGLRRTVHLWTAWGEQLHHDWERVRKSPTPPPLPDPDATSGD